MNSRDVPVIAKTKARTKGRIGRAVRQFVFASITFTMTTALAIAFSFVWFAELVADRPGFQSPMVVSPADGIVVLTGGEDRQASAIELLRAHRARRMLITGVGEHTTKYEMARLLGLDISLFNCCVDLDHEAQNTAGNADQAAKWTADNHFSSLILVTSAYHMPRALGWFAAKLPNIRVTPYAITRPGIDFAAWYSDKEALRLLLQEYPKYMASIVQRWAP